MTTRFAFYGRVSTEDQQDPASSRGWQLSRSRGLIEPHGGVIVREFFDVGQSRSLPWKRRPEAAALLDAFRERRRGFDAVVIGEPARAFYGNQFGLTFPVFVHYDVELWVPEVGGRVDPGSDAHDLVMSLYGGMSKGERNRIKVRVRSAMADQASRGVYMGGRPPYGYQLADAGPHPNPGKAADGKRLRRLEPDPTTAPIVGHIFDAYLSGLGLYAIAELLTRDGVPCPSAADPARNRHRSGVAWSKSAVRAILSNPRYTGRQVWNRQRRDEVLIDVEDVALGHETKLRWNERGEWVWSTELAHEALIDSETFVRAQQIASTGSHRPIESKRRTTERRYLLSGLVTCGLCGRRLQGNWNHGVPHYRCRFPSEYALANKVSHPKTVYVKESTIVPKLDEWLARLFDPEHIDETCKALAMADEHDEPAEARDEAARRKVEDCDRRLAKYRALLDHDAPAAIVAGWMEEVEAEREVAARELPDAPPPEPLTPSQVKALAKGMKDILRKLATADPRTKAALYTGLGLKLTYHPETDVVEVEARPQDACATERVGGGT